MSSTQETKQLARRVPEEIVTGKDLDLVEEVFAEDFVEHGPFDQEVRGRDETRAYLESFTTAFPDFEAAVEEIIAEGDLVSMRVTISGTMEAPFMGFEPTGESFEVMNQVITRVEGGEIAERWTLPDTLGMLQQLGLVPPLDELQGMAPEP